MDYDPCLNSLPTICPRHLPPEIKEFCQEAVVAALLHRHAFEAEGASPTSLQAPECRVQGFRG